MELLKGEKKVFFIEAEKKLNACLRTVKIISFFSPQSTVKTYEDGVKLLVFFSYFYSTVIFP